jgi:diguanylate cyclase (GGDEF)-like protein
LAQKADVGTVRTDILESMASSGDINISDIKIINQKFYENFPYLVSSKLYPEWPLAKLEHTEDKISRELLSKIFSIDLEKSPQLFESGNWGVPSDYSTVHAVLKKLKIAPYDVSDIRFIDVVREYIFYIYGLAFVFLAIIGRYYYINRVNTYLQTYNDQLNSEVAQRTQELHEVNATLKILAQTDSLTGISNRAHFMQLGEKYFDIAKRNESSLQVLSLDLDFFKKINDTYGHQAGDLVLIKFTRIVAGLLRKSDIFGRIGGEEFCIVLQNTSLYGALNFAQRICQNIEEDDVEFEGKIIKFTVSIGLAELSSEENFAQVGRSFIYGQRQRKKSGLYLITPLVHLSPFSVKLQTNF